MPEEFIETNESEQAPPAAPAKPNGKEETVTLSKAEVEALRRDRDEARESEKYWAQMARQGPRQAQPEPAHEPEEQFDGSPFIDSSAADGLEGDTPEKLVDDFAAKGVSALKSRGFITAADAQKLAVEVAAKVSREMISRERQKITTDTQIMTEFPELRDQQSDLFKETAKRYQKAVAMDPNAAKTPAALWLAADGAREAIRGRRPPPRQGDDEDEGDRRMRAASQDSRPRGRAEVDDQEDMIGDEARQVIRAMGITDEEFRASRKELGVRSKGRR